MPDILYRPGNVYVYYDLYGGAPNGSPIKAPILVSQYYIIF